MENIFLRMFDMSIAAGWMIMAVIVLRVLFRNIPKNICCVLWILVFVRLLCPFTLESSLSIIPGTQTVDHILLNNSRNPETASRTNVNQMVNPDMAEPNKLSVTDVTYNVNDSRYLNIVFDIIASLWLPIAFVLIIYTIITSIRLRRKVAVSIRVNDNIFICDYIDTPFILGLIKPKIFIPSGISDEQMDYVTRHEISHLHSVC